MGPAQKAGDLRLQSPGAAAWEGRNQRKGHRPRGFADRGSCQDEAAAARAGCGREPRLGQLGAGCSQAHSRRRAAHTRQRLGPQQRPAALPEVCGWAGVAGWVLVVWWAPGAAHAPLTWLSSTFMLVRVIFLPQTAPVAPRVAWRRGKALPRGQSARPRPRAEAAAGWAHLTPESAGQAPLSSEGARPP